jgi:hypothetical protein
LATVVPGDIEGVTSNCSFVLFLFVLIGVLVWLGMANLADASEEGAP